MNKTCVCAGESAELKAESSKGKQLHKGKQLRAENSSIRKIKFHFAHNEQEYYFSLSYFFFSSTSACLKLFLYCNRAVQS